MVIYLAAASIVPQVQAQQCPHELYPTGCVIEQCWSDCDKWIKGARGFCKGNGPGQSAPFSCECSC